MIFGNLNKILIEMEKMGFLMIFRRSLAMTQADLFRRKKRARPHLEPIVTRFFDYLDEKTTFSNFF